MPEDSHIVIKLNRLGIGEVLINGIDVAPRCSALKLIVEPCQKGELELTMILDECLVELEDAQVKVVHG